jgi:uncharacterized protein (DUF169 family)
MEDYRGMEKSLSETLGLQRRPVAVKFQDAPPAGVAKFTGTEPSGCSFWRLAAEGRTFYTVPSDHYNCPIGSYTHNIPLPPERAQELEQTLTLMASIGYIKMEEVPGISRLPKTPGVAVYAPLGDTPVEPDVVLFAGPAGPVMLLQEAALRASCAHGDSCRDGAGGCGEHRVYWQPRLHRRQRGRALCNDPREAPGQRRERNSDRRDGKCAAGRASSLEEASSRN